MMSYEHLNSCERKVIKKMLDMQKSIREIARYTGRAPSTISREIARNRDLYWYHPHHAHEHAVQRRKQAYKRILDRNEPLREHVIRELKEGKSPDSIAGRLTLTHADNPAMQISHESIYQWTYEQARKGNDLYKYLPRGVRKRQRRMNKKLSRVQIPNRTSIHCRPDSVSRRRYKGHWEGDTIHGKGHSGYIVTLVERKSYLLAAGIMRDKTPESCNRALLEALGEIDNSEIRSITFDNGTEFYHHEDLQEALECRTYFADPYSSWQRGINEHTNGMLRRYFPKTMSFADLTQNKVDEAVRKLNNLPRKSLGYRTPYEVFYNLSVALQT